MKREDVKAIFPNATDEEVDKILNKISGELNPLKTELGEVKNELDEKLNLLTNVQANEKTLQEQLTEATKKAQEHMSAEEILAEKIKAAEEQQRSFAIKSSELEAEKIFVSAGFDEETYAPLLEQVVSEDLEKTKTHAQSFVTIAAKLKEDTEQATKDALLKGNPKLQGAGGENITSKEEFNKLPYSQQAKMLDENPTLLKDLQ